MTISKHRNDQLLLFNNAYLTDTDTYKHLRLLFHQSLLTHSHYTLTSESDDKNQPSSFIRQFHFSPHSPYDI